MMNRDVMGRQMFANGGVARPRITDPYILETLQKLEDAMRQGDAEVAAYMKTQNLRDFREIAAAYPQAAPIINRGIAVLQSQAAPSLRQPMAPEMGKSLSDLMTPAPDGSMDYYATGPFGYEDAPEAQEAPEGFTERDVERFREDYDRYRKNEQGDQMRIPGPPPGVMEEMPEAPPYVPMALGGEPMAAAMEAGAMPAEPMAAMGAPMPADLGPAGAEGIASQMDPNVVAVMQGMSRNFGDPEQAGSLEEMMDMVRGDTASEEERRTELAGVVGPEDAQQTPDSVLALVQPLMLLMQAEGATETDTGGIGPMAQEAMNVPVSGDMAGGIMQMAAAAPAPEGGVPPVNFNRGGEVRRYEDGKVVLPNYSQVVAGKMPTVASPTLKGAVAAPKMTDFAATYKPKRTLEEAYQQRLPLLQQITGGGGKDAAGVQFLADLAKAGADFAQPGKPGQSVLSQLAASIAGSGIAENAAKLAASREATEQALKMRAFEGAEKELDAEEAARRTSELTRNTMFNQGVMALTERRQKVVDMDNAFEQNKALNEQKSALDQLQAQYNAGIGFMSQAQLLQMKDKLDTERLRLNQAFEKNKIELAHQQNIERMGLAQEYDLEKLDTSTAAQVTLQNERIASAEKIAANKLEQDKLTAAARNADAKRKREIEERLAKVKEEELSIKRHAAKLKEISDKAAQYEKPGAYVPALLNQEVEFKEVVPAASDLDAPSEKTVKAPFYKAWSEGRVPPNDPTARQIATMMENASNAETVYGGPDVGFVKKPPVRYSPELNRAIVKRSELPNSDISERVANNALVQLASGDKKALNAILDKMSRTTKSLFDGIAKIDGEPVSVTISKGAKDLVDAMGAAGLIERTFNSASRFVGRDVTSGADRGAYLARRIFVDGLQASLAALPGKENVKIQELLESVIPGDMLANKSPSAFYEKSATYLGSLEAGIDRLEKAASSPTISSEDLEKHLMALNELYSTRNGVVALRKELDLQHNITGR